MPMITQPKVDSGTDELGTYTAQLWSDAGGLTQFGAFTETLIPGSAASRPHWHLNEDEMIYVLSGTVTLIEGDTEAQLRSGDVATFKAGIPVGHCLRNESSEDVSYLVIGTRSGNDVVTYTDNGDTLIVADGIKTLRNEAGTILKTSPYHGA